MCGAGVGWVGDEEPLLGAGLPASLAGVVPCHWARQPRPATGWVVGAAILYSTITAVTLPANGLLLAVWARFRTVRTPSNTFVISLASSGSLMVSTFPIFFINLCQGGPFLGIVGGQVKKLKVYCDKTYININACCRL